MDGQLWALLKSISLLKICSYYMDKILISFKKFLISVEKKVKNSVSGVRFKS